MASISGRAARYSAGAIAMHWIIALLIALNFALVWTAQTLSKPEQAQLMAYHKAVGITVLTLSVLRILWRLTHPAPAFAPTLKGWEVALARIVHGLFYFLMIGIPLTGWLMVSAFSSKGVSVFGLFTLPSLAITQGKATGGMLHGVHEKLAWLLIALFALHLAGALKHQFLNRDGTLGRMIPWFARP